MIHLIFPQAKHKQRHSLAARADLLFNYLLNKKRTVPAKLLSGDPEIATQLIRTCDYAEPYTSLALSFTEKLSESKCRKIIGEYEDVAFAGIEKNEICRVWVLHEDHERTELHCVVVNIHLPSGNSWKHFYCGSDANLFKNWQELTNIKHEFSSPDEPARNQIKAPPLKDQDRSDDQELLMKIDEKVISGIFGGKLTNQVEIVSFINSLGFTAWGTKKQVSIRKPGHEQERPLRLTGDKYRRDFQSATYFSANASKKKKLRRDADRLKEIERELQVGLLIRRNRMRGRFSEKSTNIKGKEQQNEPRRNQRIVAPSDQKLGKPNHRKRGEPSKDDGRFERDYRRDLVARGQSLKRKLINLGLRILNGGLRKDQKTMVFPEGKPRLLQIRTRRHAMRLFPNKSRHVPAQVETQRRDIEPKQNNESHRRRPDERKDRLLPGELDI